MAKILALETSTKNCSVAVFESRKLLAAKDEVDEKYAHAERLNLMIEATLEEAQLEPKDLDAVAVGKGPGSYTGLRIGVSSAKGLAYALDIPVLTFHSIDPLFFAAREKLPDADLYFPMIDARRMEVFTAGYSPSGEAQAIEAVELDAAWFSQWKDKRIVLVGDGAEKCRELTKGQEVEIIDTWPSCTFVGDYLAQKWAKSQFEDLAYFEPFYLKEFIAGEPKKLAL